MEITYTTFEDYLRNDLNDHDVKQLLKQLETDEELKKSFKEYKLMRDNLVKKFNVKSDKELLEHLEKYGDRYFTGRDDKRNNNGGSSFRSFRWLYSMAAGLLILFGLLWGFKVQVQDMYSTDYLVKNAKISVIEKSRGAVDNETETEILDASNVYFKKLNKLYSQDDYVELLRMNNMDLLEGNDKITANLFLAESYIQLNEFEKSKDLCDELLSITEGETTSKVEFVLARAYVGIGDRQRGIELLERLSQEDTAMKKPAGSLLKDLKSFKHWLSSL